MIDLDACERLLALATDPEASDEERRNAAVLVCAFLKESRHFQNSRAAATLIVTAANGSLSTDRRSNA